MLDVVRTKTADQINLYSLEWFAWAISSQRPPYPSFRWNEVIENKTANCYEDLEEQVRWRSKRVRPPYNRIWQKVHMSYVELGEFTVMAVRHIWHEMYAALCSVQVLIHGSLCILRKVPLSLRDSPHTVRELNMDVWKWFHNLQSTLALKIRCGR